MAQWQRLMQVSVTSVLTPNQVNLRVQYSVAMLVGMLSNDLFSFRYKIMAAKLSSQETDFLELQRRLKEILSIPAKNRSDDERKEYDRLRKSYTKEKGNFPRLVEDCAAATGAQRMAEQRQRMTEEHCSPTVTVTSFTIHLQTSPGPHSDASAGKVSVRDHQGEQH